MSEALIFAEHGENILCTKIVLNVRNNIYTQHVQGEIFPILGPKTRGNEFQRLAVWGTIFVGAKHKNSFSKPENVEK